MPELSKELGRQIRAAGDGPVRVTDPETHREYVIVSADLFDQLREGAYDDGPWTEDEMDRLAAEQADLLGWEGMEPYQGDNP